MFKVLITSIIQLICRQYFFIPNFQILQMMQFQLMPIDHLIELLHKFRLDQIVREAWEDLDELRDRLPTVAKLSKVLVDEEGE